MKLTRRDFIKTAGAATGTMAISSVIPMPAWAEGQNGGAILTAARWGAVYVEVKDGKVVSSKGALPKTVPNSLQQTAPDQVHTNIRVKYPMVRKSYLENWKSGDVKPELRGKEEYVRVDWDTALKLTAKAIVDTIEQHGNQAILSTSYGGWSHGGLMRPNVMQGKFFNMIGGNIGWYSDYSAACIQHAWPYLYGGFGYGGVRSTNDGAGSYMNQVKNAKLYVTFGNNPAVTRASGGGQSWELYGALREGKTRMVVIDPICTDTLAGRDAEWVAIRPGTDGCRRAGPQARHGLRWRALAECCQALPIDQSKLPIGVSS